VRGADLARDIAFTDCQVLVTERSLLPLLDGLELGAAAGRVLVVDDPAYEAALGPFRGHTLPEVAVRDADPIFLLFTSGTAGAPKAVIRTHGRIDFVAQSMVQRMALTADDVTYVSMPLFHSNALFTGWAPSVVAGAAVALRRRFSASEFLADVRRFGATYFNYVGKPLAYILATPERPDDADNPLRRGFGNEANEVDIREFERRFGCPLTDGYGQTETGVSISRVPGMPPGALGLAPPGVAILDPVTGVECARARFDEHGRLLNAEEATGEIVATAGTLFEGYYKNDDANRERLRAGAYWSGDLGYRDEAGFFYFAGRTSDWLRVDGENMAAAPIEQVLLRHPDVVLAAVYGVPDPEAGDRVMAALQMRDGAVFDPEEFMAFVAAQADLGPKAVPTFVRVMASLPMTQTNKVLKRDLVRERWDTTDVVWWRPDRESGLCPFTGQDAARVEERFAAHGRSALLGR